MDESLLPLFPLPLVAYPGELLNLHIFEPRYKEMIHECVENERPFGICPYIDGKVMALGTQMRVIEIETKHEDGSLDIRTRGESVFEVTKFVMEVPERLYAAGEIAPVPLTFEYEKDSQEKLIDRMQELHEFLGLEPYEHGLDEMSSFDIAHKIGLNIEQEFALLGLTSEQDRQLFLLEHLNHVLPVVRQIEQMKDVIKQNGHFKHLQPPEF